MLRSSDVVVEVPEPGETLAPSVVIFLAAYRDNALPAVVVVDVRTSTHSAWSQDRGMWFDGGADGMYKTQTRYYQPGVGRFTQSDPAKDGQNWYAYAGGDPVNKWDPSGLAAYYFDGTGNHPNATNPWDGSANFKTNVRHLFEAYVGDKFYAYGIGTGYDPAGGAYSKDTLFDGAINRYDSEMATGGTMHERVNWMMGNSNWKYNDSEQRTMPGGFIIHSATGWYDSPTINTWSAPTFAFPGGALPPAHLLPADLLGYP